MKTALEELNDRLAEHEEDCGHCSCCDTCGEMCGEGSYLREEVSAAEAALAA